ncbi:unnamed protein product [Alopecurus aequalis]
MAGNGAPPSAAAAAASISAVLGDDDLLVEILLRVSFPTTLVRAALACKRWLSHARAPAFLRRFRRLHPPRHLGFYISTMGSHNRRFVPLPQPPELATVVLRGSFDLGTLQHDSHVLSVRCCNGLLLLTTHRYPEDPRRTKVLCPLHPARYTAILPAVPDTSVHDASLHYDENSGQILHNDGDGSDAASYFYLTTVVKQQQTIIDVYALRDGLWGIYSSVVSEIPKIHLMLPSLLGDDKIYNAAFVNNTYKLVVLDLLSSSMSIVNFPEEVEHLLYARLSLADDSGVYLTRVKGFQLRIWLYKRDNNGVPNWSLVDTICLREICANHMIPTCMSEDVDDHIFEIQAVGVNSEIVYMEMNGVLYQFDIKNKAAKKVYEITQEDTLVLSVTPFMIAWPPKFPVVKDGCDPKE